jgi:hypothetical protein
VGNGVMAARMLCICAALSEREHALVIDLKGF